MPNKSKKNRWDRGIDFKRNVTIMLIVIGLAIIGFMIFIITLEKRSSNPSSENLIGNGMDVYGLGLDPSSEKDGINNNNILLNPESHHGLFKNI